MPCPGGGGRGRQAGTQVAVWVSVGLGTRALRGGISVEGPERPRVELVGQQKGPGWPSADTPPPWSPSAPRVLCFTSLYCRQEGPES